ncbi:unnamed protein product [Effrenium voratum]|nr:unnamed protein product [Effrenium voratum]
MVLVGTPPEQKLRTKSYELVPPWAVESDTGPPQSAGRGSRGTRLEEAALKAQEVARNVEAALGPKFFGGSDECTDAGIEGLRKF